MFRRLCSRACEGDCIGMGVVWLDLLGWVLLFVFVNDAATTEIYTEWFVGSVRCV